MSLVEKKSSKKRVNLDELVEDAEEQEKSDAEHSDVGSHAADEDYDVDEEYDNDYADNYFDNGEGDDMDDLGGGGGDEGGGGKSCFRSAKYQTLTTDDRVRRLLKDHVPMAPLGHGVPTNGKMYR